MSSGNRIRLRAALGLLATALGGCGPRTTPAEPGPTGAGDDGGATEAERQAECERLFDEALEARSQRALAQLDERRVRAAVLAEVVARAPGEGQFVASARALLEAVLAEPAVREELMRAFAQSSRDGDVLLSWGASLLTGQGVEERLRQAVAQVKDALVEAARQSGLTNVLLALPEVGALLEALLPDDRFAPVVAAALGRLSQAQSAADARLRLTVPGDVEATRRSVDSWAQSPAGLDCRPVVRSFPLGAAVADLPAARAALDGAAAQLLPAAVMREETVALVRDLMADANFRLALDELLVRVLRGDGATDVVVAANAVLASPSVPRAVAVWAGRVLARRAELPDLGEVLAPLAADPDFASVLLRFLDVLVMSEGCVGL